MHGMDSTVLGERHVLISKPKAQCMLYSTENSYTTKATGLQRDKESQSAVASRTKSDISVYFPSNSSVFSVLLVLFVVFVLGEKRIAG